MSHMHPLHRCRFNDSAGQRNSATVEEQVIQSGVDQELGRTDSELRGL